jgi:hypothetical protein
MPAQATAVGARNNHILVSIVASWEHNGDAPGDDGDAQHLQWAHAVSQALALHALPGGYPNLLGPDEHPQIAAAYGSNAERLCDAKWRFDPEGLFTATPLPCSASRGMTPQSASQGGNEVPALDHLPEHADPGEDSSIEGHHIDA